MTSRIERKSPTWTDFQPRNPWLFPSVLDLAQDGGPIGHFLRLIPVDFLRDANRCPNPWEDLASMRLMNPIQRELFHACASVLPAALSLAETVYSRGDVIERGRRATTSAEREAVARKLFPGMWRAGAGMLRDASAQAGQEMLAQFEEREAQLLKTIAKKHGKAAAAIRSEKPTAERLRKKWPVLYLMLTNWVRFGHFGDPGLMFFSDRALADLFSLLDWRGFDVRADNFDSEQIEQMRGRLGLLKANEKFPLVTGARMDAQTGVIELNTKEPKLAQFEWPKSPLQLRCKIVLEGKSLYGGATN